MSRFVIFVHLIWGRRNLLGMNISLALAAIVGVLLGATAIGMFCKARSVRVKRVAADNRGAALRVTPSDVALPVETQFGPEATLLQFSTQFCSKCPGTARLLKNEVSELAGVKHIEVDLTNQLDVAKRFNVLQTPTVLVLNGTGEVTARITGAPTAAVIRDELASLGALPFSVEHAEAI